MTDQPPAADPAFIATHVWKSEHYDWPCTLTGRDWRDELTGKDFVEVLTADGQTHTLPKDQVGSIVGAAPPPSLAAGDQAACDELVARARANPGAPFADEAVAALAALKGTKGKRAVYESLRTDLRKAGVRVTELDKLIGEAAGETPGGPPTTQADVIVALAEAAELFQDASEIAYADIEVNGHRETWAIRAHGFQRWLRRLYHEETKGAPATESFNSALNVLEAKAQHSGLVREVYVRVAGLEDRIYLDLCDSAWRAIEATETGWRVVEEPPIRFRRSPDMRPLPVPAAEGEGSVDGLRRLMNIPDGPEGDHDFVLAIAWVLGALRGCGPYPVMAIGGEQGTAKSTRSAILRSLIDPGKPTLRALPRDERDLVVAAYSRHALAFDNVSGLPWWMSDAYCRIASGAGFGTRMLYTDTGEVTFEGARPLIFNGIEDFIERPDLAERTIFSICQLIDGRNRLTEAEIWAAFRATHPGALGALLDAVVEGLKRFSAIRAPDLPRMADFAHWAIACEPALWKGGHFMDAYNANILGAVESVLEASRVAVAVRVLMESLKAVGQTRWVGTATELLGKLTPLIDERITKSKEWPSNGRALSGQLRRAASFLRRVGIHVAFTREGHVGARTVTIRVGTPLSGGNLSPADGTFASDRQHSGPTEAASGAAADGQTQKYRQQAKVSDPEGVYGSEGAAAATATAGILPGGSIPLSGGTLSAGDATFASGASPRAPEGDAFDAKVASPAESALPEGVCASPRGMLRVLDLCCCAGGAARGLRQAGAHVVGVDTAPQPRYAGHRFILADALEFLAMADLGEFDFIWASPPCQFATEMKHSPNAKGDANPNLIPPTRELLIASGKPYCIENVEAARPHLRNPILLCGTMFGLASSDGVAELQRHRYFETSFPLLAPACQHSGRPVVSVIGAHFRNRRRPPKRAQNPNHAPGTDWSHEQGFSAMGIPLDSMQMDEISEAIPPAYAKYILEAFLRWRATKERA
jgi:hypothetical protein